MPQGHPSALGELGRLHAVGHGRERNYHTALKYLLQGAHLADPTGTASAMLGHLLLRKVRVACPVSSVCAACVYVCACVCVCVRVRVCVRV